MINTIDKFIQRGDLANGRPKPDAKPVVVMTPAYPNGTWSYQTGLISRRVDANGTYCDLFANIASERNYDLLPWPKPPKIVTWNCLDDIVWDAVYRRKMCGSLGRLTYASKSGPKFGCVVISFYEFSGYEHTRLGPDGKIPANAIWLPCTKEVPC